MAMGSHVITALSLSFLFVSFYYWSLFFSSSPFWPSGLAAAAAMPESPERRRQVLLIRGRINARWGCLRSEPLLEQQVMRLARALRVRCSETEQAQLLAGFIPEWMEEEIVADGFLAGRPAGRPPAAPPAAAHAAAPGEGLGGERAPEQRGELGAALASEDAPAAPDAPEAPLAVAEPAGPPERVLCYFSI